MDEAEIERDARIIDPASWRCLDALILGLTTGAACDTVAMSRAVREGVTDAASLKAWWLNPDDLDTWAEKGCRSSLRKAAEINTARSEGRKAADTALSERVAELERGLEGGWLPIVLCPTDGAWRLVKLPDGQEVVASFDGDLLGARRWRTKTFGYHNPARPTREKFGGIERMTAPYNTAIISDLPEGVCPTRFRPNDTVYGKPALLHPSEGEAGT